MKKYIAMIKLDKDLLPYGESPFIEYDEYVYEGEVYLSATNMEEAKEEVKQYLHGGYCGDTIETLIEEESMTDPEWQSPVSSLTIMEREVTDTFEFDIKGYVDPLMAKMKVKQDQEQESQERAELARLQAKFGEK